MGAFLLALAFLALVVCMEECIQPRRQARATWD